MLKETLETTEYFSIVSTSRLSNILKNIAKNREAGTAGEQDQKDEVYYHAIISVTNNKCLVSQPRTARYRRLEKLIVPAREAILVTL